MHILNSLELEKRRKRSHSTKLLSLDHDKPEAIFGASSSRNGSTYTTTLTSCTCRDFASGFGIRPCRHIFRLASELKLFQCEHDMTQEYGDNLKSVYLGLDDSKESKRVKSLIRKALTEKLYGFNTSQEAVEFINGLKLTIPQIKEILGGGNGKKAEIIAKLADSTAGHSHRQLLRWLIDQIYKHGTIEECEEFLTSLRMTTPQIMEVAAFRGIHLSGNSHEEFIKSLVAETVGKTARYTGNVITI